MAKLLNGVVFARPEDDEYEGIAHVWVRDAQTSYWFSLSRAVGANVIEVMASDQLTFTCDVISVTLDSTGFRVQVNAAAACALDGHLEYVVRFHPESDGIDVIEETLKVIFRGKEGLTLLSTSDDSEGPFPA